MKACHYEIRISGRLSETLVAAFDGLTAKASSAETLLCGEIDQAALHGVLERIQSLGLELVEVRRLTPPITPGGSPCHPFLGA
jgi:hypothetical protein